jgi:hypothetical protein
MAKKPLRNDEIALGRAVLLATDALGMSAEGAFWLYDAGDTVWRFFLVTSMFERVGPRKTFRRLNEALAKKLSERESRQFTLFVAEPREKLVQDLRRKIQTSAYASDPQKITVEMDGKRTQAWVYRMSPGLGEEEAKVAQRRFGRLYNELIAA